MLNDIMLENLRLWDVNPLICGEEACEPGHTFGPAARDYYLLHYVLSGKGTFFFRRAVIHCDKGADFCHPPARDDVLPRRRAGSLALLLGGL